MYELKTKETDESVTQFIESVEQPKKREDTYRLLDIFTEASGYKAKMWGPSMIGFGKYHYKYKTGHEGDYFIVGFSPRKAKISLYFAQGSWRDPLLEDFGKHTTGKSCVYINKLEDIDENILIKLITASIAQTSKLYPDSE